MNGRVSPDLSELAYHIASLCNFWKRSGSPPPSCNRVHVISTMIGICLGIDNADKIACAVVLELDFITEVKRAADEVDPEGIEVIFISALLREQAGELEVPAATTYWASVFD